MLSAELKQAGHAVSVLHVNEQLGFPFVPEAIERWLAEREAELVALSFGSNHAAAAAQVAEVATRLSPRPYIMAGGAHTTLYPEQVMEWPGMQIAALGEMDDGRLVEALAELEAGRLPRKLRGFWVREGEHLSQNPIGSPVDLSRSRLVDLELFDHRRILRHKRGWADVHAGRGCPQRCTYCFNEPLRQRYLTALTPQSSSRLGYVRRRPVGLVLAELEEYLRLYAPEIRVFSFTDDQFLSDRGWVEEFFASYRERYRIPVVYLSSPAAITPRLAELSASASVYMVRMGLESGSERVRERILGRRTPLSTVAEAIRTLQEHGINAFVFQMVGIPGETESELFSTFRVTAELSVDAVKFSLFWPYPGTELGQKVMEGGLVRPGYESVGNNVERSPLWWSPRRTRLLERLVRFYDVALNRAREVGPAGEYARLLREVLDRPSSWFDTGGAAELRRSADRLNRRVLDGGDAAYVAPFEERHDILVLEKRGRARPLLL